jgi:hypothetical protein
MMNIKLATENRKAAAARLAELTGAEARYTRVPRCAYEVGAYTLEKDGTITIEEGADLQPLKILADEGFIENFEAPAEESTTESEPEAIGLTVEIPFDKVNVGNLMKLLDAKGDLIKKALGISDIRIEMKEDRVAFPWFTEVEPESAIAYTNFIAALCRMTNEAKRVTATAKEVENEKYAFRCFLLRLGFIGAEYKKDRKILLQNLSGSAAFRDGKKSHEEA